MRNLTLELDDLKPLSSIAPKFAEWLQDADRKTIHPDAHYIMVYYGRKLTAAEAIFCGDYARHLILGTPEPNLNEGSFDCSPMYRQALLEKIVRHQLKLDNYVLPLAIPI